MARMEWAEQELKLAGYDINDDGREYCFCHRLTCY